MNTTFPTVSIDVVCSPRWHFPNLFLRLVVASPGRHRHLLGSDPRATDRQRSPPCDPSRYSFPSSFWNSQTSNVRRARRDHGRCFCHYLFPYFNRSSCRNPILPLLPLLCSSSGDVILTPTFTFSVRNHTKTATTQPGVADPEMEQLVNEKVDVFWKGIESGSNKRGQVLSRTLLDVRPI